MFELQRKNEGAPMFLFLDKKNGMLTQVWWYRPVILAGLEVEIWRIMLQFSPDS
jgi:hypothetical protein